MVMNVSVIHFSFLGGVEWRNVFAPYSENHGCRPSHPIKDMLVFVPSYFLLPSAHTCQASSLALAEIMVLKTDRPKRWRGAFFTIVVILASFVGYSREYPDVLYFADVVAVALLGLLWNIRFA